MALATFRWAVAKGDTAEPFCDMVLVDLAAVQFAGSSHTHRDPGGRKLPAGCVSPIESLATLGAPPVGKLGSGQVHFNGLIASFCG